MEIPPDTLEAVGVNDLFVTVTVDASFTTEQAVVGHIDEIQIFPVFFDLTVSRGDFFFPGIVDVCYTLTSELMFN